MFPFKEKREMKLIGSHSELAGASSELDASGALSVLVASTGKPGPANVRWSIFFAEIMVAVSNEEL